MIVDKISETKRNNGRNRPKSPPIEFFKGFLKSKVKDAEDDTKFNSEINSIAI